MFKKSVDGQVFLDINLLLKHLNVFKRGRRNL